MKEKWINDDSVRDVKWKVSKASDFNNSTTWITFKTFYKIANISMAIIQIYSLDRSLKFPITPSESSDYKWALSKISKIHFKYHPYFPICF